MNLDNWADKWHVSHVALEDLRRVLGTVPGTAPVAETALRAETDVLNFERVRASEQGARLWRNNVGAAHTDTGSFIRYGLANDSAQMNRVLKSSDLIGIRPVGITEADVGKTFGLFVARECKRPGWKFTGTERETAQLAFIQLVTALGGDAKFTTGQP